MSANITVPDYILRRQTGGGLAKMAMAGLSSGAPPYISIKGNRFTFVDIGGNQKPWNQLSLQVVIVDANPHTSKTYYDQAYDPSADSYAAPACWSDNGQAPSEYASRPQASSCASCQHNQWGSKINAATGGQTKACADQKKVAVIVPAMDNMVFLLRIPAASLRPFAKYAAMINGYSLGTRNMDLDDVLTEISFDASAVGILEFRAAGMAPEDVVNLLPTAVGPGKTDMLVGKTDQPRQAALPAPAPAPLPAPAPAPVQAAPAAPVQFAPTPVQAAPVQAPAAQPVSMFPAQPEAAKGRGRPRKEAAPAAPVQANPFAQQAPAAPQPAPAAQSFGMVSNPQVASGTLADDIMKAFKV